MSCSQGKFQEDCVCEVVRKIVKAQDEVAAAANDNCCTTGCKQSIDQLLSPTVSPVDTTIPFLLYCKGDCDLFVATGVKGNAVYDCVETAVFRAKKIDKGCCAVLELLEFEEAPCPPHHHDKKASGCDLIVPPNTGNLVETGICITVDLHCFCAIQCLSPTTPLEV
ncbi:CotY/CotZ family spore coat protein [Ornithinibacillus salinisoli]|uniref:CotY/CotZ family spore coat protein n=1 Tax=Ornithinibacillus salinisoli TaxID=1848459 RepID=A0ABW4VX99_9BACI